MMSLCALKLSSRMSMALPSQVPDLPDRRLTTILPWSDSVPKKVQFGTKGPVGSGPR